MNPADNESDRLEAAIRMHEAGRLTAASDLYEALYSRTPLDPQLLYLSGLCRLELGDLTLGIERMKNLVASRPAHAAGHQALGKALAESGDVIEGAGHLAEALRLDPGRVDSALELARIAIDLGRLDKAEEILRHAVEASPQDCRPYVNLGDVLRRQQRNDEAFDTWGAALKIDPANIEARINAALYLAFRNDMGAAIGLLHDGLAIDQESPGLLCTLGRLELNRGGHEEAAALLDKALQVQPDYREAAVLRAQAAIYLCDWDALERAAPSLDLEIASARDGKRCVISPFFSLQLDLSEADCLSVAQSAARQRAEALAPLRASFGPPLPPRAKGRLHIGYFSADWHDHPNGQIMCGAFRHHNRDLVEVTVLADCLDDGSDCRREINETCDRLVDLTGLDVINAAKTIRDLDIDILVDVQGYTGMGRSNIPALRPAPVQILYQGFCGTTGGDWTDYVIVDQSVVPPASRKFYTEALVYMPTCFMVTNNTMQIDKEPPTREQEGLPADGIVFCSFSNPYKITRSIFTRWMAILRRVPNSILWLIGGPDTMMRNLEGAAVAHGIDPERIVFARRCPKQQHLARHCHADLFLNTPVYGAHVSALDSLWAGTPVLTLAGDRFIGRVSTSFNANLGLQDLIATDLDAYENIAVALAQTPGRLKALRRQLLQARSESRLFDTPRWISDIEKAYRAMWDAAVAGEQPRVITVN